MASPRVSAIRLLAHSYGFFFDNFPRLFLAGQPLFILTVAMALPALALADRVSHPQGPLLTLGLLTLLAVGAYLLALNAFQVAVFRLALAGEQPAPLFFLRSFHGRELRYALAGFCLFLAGTLPVLLMAGLGWLIQSLLTTSLSLSEEVSGGLVGLAWVAFLVGWSIYLLKYLMVLPGVASGQALGVRQMGRLGQGWRWRLVLFFILQSIPLVLAQGALVLIQAALGLEDIRQASLIQMLVLFFASFVLSLASSVIPLAGLAKAFETSLAEQKQEAEAQE